jgi:hypothetical protein
MKCCICQKAAEVIDTEYDEAYCEPCAAGYEVFDGPHRWLQGDGSA